MTKARHLDEKRDSVNGVVQDTTIQATCPGQHRSTLQGNIHDEGRSHERDEIIKIDGDTSLIWMKPSFELPEILFARLGGGLTDSTETHNLGSARIALTTETQP